MLFNNFLSAVAFVLDGLLNLYFWVVIISALLSWVNPDPYNPIVRMLRNLTEPVYARIRQYMPFVVVSGMDLSPLVVIFAIQFAQMFLVRSLRQVAFG